ncbi:MAG: hypothetical protein ACRERC_11735 [Candidatus Binatia bacterium]
MRRLVIATLLMGGLVSGCFSAEQQKTAEYERFLKRTLGVVQFEPAAPQRQAAVPHGGADAAN